MVQEKEVKTCIDKEKLGEHFSRTEAGANAPIHDLSEFKDISP